MPDRTTTPRPPADGWKWMFEEGRWVLRHGREGRGSGIIFCDPAFDPPMPALRAFIEQAGNVATPTTTA